MSRNINTIVKLALGTGVIAATGAMAAKAMGSTFLRGLPPPPTHQVSDYDTAMEKIAHIHAFEEKLPMQSICKTQVFTHGHKVEQVVILMHGITSCPRQFVELGELLFKQGYNVFLPRMPYNGYTDLDTTVLRHLTTKELRDSCATSIDIAHGLGERVTFAGLSVGGVMAAWVAQYRADVDRAVLISPSFTIDRRLDIGATKFAMYLLYVLPNLMTQKFRHGQGSPFGYRGFATRSLGVMLRFGYSIFQAALQTKPAVQNILVVTNAADPAINNNVVRNLVQRWQKRGLRYCEMYEFDARYQLPHDLIGILTPKGNVEVVYPVLVDLITHRLADEEANR